MTFPQLSIAGLVAETRMFAVKDKPSDMFLYYADLFSNI